MPEALTDAKVMEMEGLSRRTFFRRLKSGALRRLPEGGIDPASLSLDARRKLLGADIEPAPKSGQGNLFMTDIVSALSIPEKQKPVVQDRLELVEQCVNGNWRAAGYTRKRDFVYFLAAERKVSGRHVERWIARYKAAGKDPASLCDRKPGPEAADPRAIEEWMKLSLMRYYEQDKLLVRQCWEKLMAEIDRRQTAWTFADLYPRPSYHDVRRFLRRRYPIEEAARNGTDALKASLGYIDRDWTDLHSLDRVDVDEWITDLFSYDPQNATRVSRMLYLITFLDARSLYPLEWILVESPDEEAEIDLLVALIQNYGVPGLIHSDRGRYRGRTFGGQFRDTDRTKMFGQVDGMMDRLGIRRNMGREHNPRGSRLERFHKELANWARMMPGWVGADAKQRKMTPGDAQKEQHMDWVRGRKDTDGRPIGTPLLSRDALRERINEFMTTWRERPSEGGGMNGCSPARVFADNVPQIFEPQSLENANSALPESPERGFRRISEAELAWHTAQHFPDETIEPGGVITLPDKKRYSHALLLLIQGERREVVRLRSDDSFISILPVHKGEEVILAPIRQRVGNTDSQALADAHERQGYIRKAVMAYLHPGNGDPAGRPLIPRAIDSIPARDLVAQSLRRANSAAYPPALECIPEPEPEPAVPSLYEFEAVSVEEM